MRLFNIFETAFTKLGLIDDFAVERGTSGIWTYRKWNSGTAESGTRRRFRLLVAPHMEHLWADIMRS